ncbi:hypothetical protein KEM48_001753 [Puccinia striiformis f. sp. tritici PST-130]|nr:hypothetical protein KEM48_001753 [Puccinia striiformis f. sp. tritici PST-130]
MGGLISAYDLSGDELMLERAKELAEWLVPALVTSSGLPSSCYQMDSLVSPLWLFLNPSGKHTGRVCIAEIGSLTLEFTRLSQLTSKEFYYDVVQKITDLSDSDQWISSSRLGTLFPTHLNPQSPQSLSGQYTFGVMANSYYKYLIKHQLSQGTNSQYSKMYTSAIESAREHLIRTYNLESNGGKNLTVIGDIAWGMFNPSLNHLTCFLGAMIGLGSQLLGWKQDLDLALEHADACVWAYESTTTGVGPEQITIVEGDEQTQWQLVIYKEEGQVSVATAVLEQAKRERATNQAYLVSKAAKGLLARQRGRRDVNTAILAEKRVAAEANTISPTTEQPQPVASGSGTFTVPAEPAEEENMSFNNIFGDGPPVGPTAAAPEAEAKKPLTGGKIWPKDHLHVKMDSAHLQNFPERYKKAAEMEGVNNCGMAMQIGNFVENSEDLADIGEMKGYKAEDWEELKKEMIAKWGKGVKHYKEGDLLKLAMERLKGGGVTMIEAYREYTAAFDRVLRYLNKNKIVIGISGMAKRSYLRVFKEEDRGKIHWQLFIKGLIAMAVDGRVTALPEMDVICEAIQWELKLGCMMKEGEVALEQAELRTTGTGTKGTKPVTRANISVLTNQMRDMQLFMHRKATSAAPFCRPDPVTVSSAGPSGPTPAPVAQLSYPSGLNFAQGQPVGPRG